MSKKLRNLLYLGLILNTVLTVLKIVFGYLGNSVSLVSDGYNSLTDILISLVLLITIRISYKKADHDHPYGHEKYEGIASLLLGIILILTAIFIFYTGVQNIIELVNVNTVLKPDQITIYIAVISIIIKVTLFYINGFAYKKYKQPSLKAEKYNHLIDVLATTTSLLGIILTQYGFIYFDAIASLIIGLFIVRTAYGIIKEAISYLVDQAPDDEVNTAIKKVISEVIGVLNIDDYKSRMHVNKLYVDVEVAVDATLSLQEAHLIAEKVHKTVESTFPDVIHCMVHVNPSKANK
ncbi:Cobalt-zinc-cadmium efflux protein, transporter [Alteracholeplasma palmae J233]|uniref:Cobalt-zinc-cadmium efflux protein, transporter n=1 Tax=Alteracholeplasma palmae (strain ATCC 49389 / J233) TaxID=1318466 RepID=U4KL98_ALTPJ|nr:cation diffusion facilitator family transporter [Alteracholeplasma palmae]CCV64679.1 Cobalt-zinc-cadmium efflux protein, transporter [Alteracholeplasma palmae J233]